MFDPFLIVLAVLATSVAIVYPIFHAITRQIALYTSSMFVIMEAGIVGLIHSRVNREAVPLIWNAVVIISFLAITARVRRGVNISRLT